MPPDKRGDFSQIGNAMPAWPEIGGIVVVDDSVLLKLDPYSYAQVRQICKVGNMPKFCESVVVLTE